MDLKDQGELIYRNQFTVQQGKDPEFKAMVFLFEKIMLFTSVKLEVTIFLTIYYLFKKYLYYYLIASEKLTSGTNKSTGSFEKFSFLELTGTRQNISWAQII